MAKQTTKPQPARTQTRAADPLLIQCIDEFLKDLAIKENRVGLLARKALRMRYDGEKLSEEDSANVRRLLQAIGNGINLDAQADPVSGKVTYHFEVPVELRDPEPPATPEWVTETPHQEMYDLEMSEGTSGSVQHISLTRDEYIELKRHLAVMRGHMPTITATTSA